MKKKPHAPKRKLGYSYDEFYDSISTVWGWTLVIVGSMVLGFVGGYWLGHREIMPVKQTVRAFAKIPLLWLGFKQVILAYLVTGIAWYLPFHLEDWRLHLAAPSVTFFTWLAVIISVVLHTQGSKFMQY